MTAPTRKRTRGVVAAAVVALVAAGTVAVLQWDSGGEPDRPALLEYPLGQRPPAPPIAGELLAGGRYELAAQRGEVVVVNIWASWCAPCRAETADLERVYQSTKDLGVGFVGLDIQDEREAAIRFLAGRVTYPSIYDPGFEAGFGFTEPPAPVGPPATLVVDRSGDLAVAIYRQVGRVELEQAVRRVASEERPPDG